MTDTWWKRNWADWAAAVIVSVALLGITAVVVSAVSAPVTGSRAECEQANPGKVCGIFWLPANPSQP